MAYMERLGECTLLVFEWPSLAETYLEHAKLPTSASKSMADSRGSGPNIETQLDSTATMGHGEWM